MGDVEETALLKSLNDFRITAIRIAWSFGVACFALGGWQALVSYRIGELERWRLEQSIRITDNDRRLTVLETILIDLKDDIREVNKKLTSIEEQLRGKPAR